MLASKWNHPPNPQLSPFSPFQGGNSASCWWWHSPVLTHYKLLATCLLSHRVVPILFLCFNLIEVSFRQIIYSHQYLVVILRKRELLNFVCIAYGIGRSRNRMLFLFATLFHPSDVERSLDTSGKLLNRGMRRFNFPMKIISKNRGDFK